MHVLFSNSSLFENEVFGEGDFIKNVCVRITLLVFPLFQTFFPYKFLNVFWRKVAWMPITKQSLSIQAKGVWSGTSPSYLPPTLGCLFPAVLSPLSMEYFLSRGWYVFKLLLIDNINFQDFMTGAFWFMSSLHVLEYYYCQTTHHFYRNLHFSLIPRYLH